MNVMRQCLYTRCRGLLVVVMALKVDKLLLANDARRTHRPRQAGASSGTFEMREREHGVVTQSSQ
jgi:hypothetical protein